MDVHLRVLVSVCVVTKHQSTKQRTPFVGSNLLTSYVCGRCNCVRRSKVVSKRRPGVGSAGALSYNDRKLHCDLSLKLIALFIDLDLISSIDGLPVFEMSPSLLMSRKRKKRAASDMPPFSFLRTSRNAESYTVSVLSARAADAIEEVW